MGQRERGQPYVVGPERQALGRPPGARGEVVPGEGHAPRPPLGSRGPHHDVRARRRPVEDERRRLPLRVGQPRVQRRRHQAGTPVREKGEHALGVGLEHQRNRRTPGRAAQRRRPLRHRRVELPVGPDPLRPDQRDVVRPPGRQGQHVHGLQPSARPRARRSPYRATTLAVPPSAGISSAGSR